MTDPEEEHMEEDLGLGEEVVQENRTRFVNPDGSFNVHRKGIFEHGSFSPYHAILSMSWRRFYAWLFMIYVLFNFLFTAFYMATGSRGFPQLAGATVTQKIEQLFFYSVQVMTTLGSSPLHPATTAVQAILALEAMLGMVGFALAAGIVFARFSNPAVKIVFSTQAVIAPHKKGTAFMFRIINGRSNELVDLAATVTLVFTDARGKRSFHQLKLEREGVLVFPLSWTIVHSITKASPLFGMAAQDLARTKAEFLISLTAVDKDLSKKVYAHYSYLYNEVVVGARFRDILEHTTDGTVIVDPKRIHEIEPAARVT